jgi:uncharacterized membrane protein
MSLVVAACVSAILYAIAGGSRQVSTRTTSHEIDELAVFVSASLATLLLVLLEWRALPPPAVGVAWAISGAILLGIGFWRRTAADLRLLAYAVLTLSAGWELDTVMAQTRNGSLLWAIGEIALLFAVPIASRAAVARANPTGRSPEEQGRIALLVLNTLLLTLLVFQRMDRSLLVPAWGLEGMLLLFSGFLLRERALRLSGLGLLLLCLLRLGYDVQRLDALGRIISFVVLGLVLLAVSWVYTRFREQMKKWL